MVDFKVSGSWLRWSEIDRPSRWLITGSMLSAIVGAIPLALRSIDRHRPLNPSNPIPPFEPWMIWITIAGLGLALFLGSQFVKRQDEMFRNAQAWVTGTASNWTLAWLGFVYASDLQNPHSFGFLLILMFSYAIIISITWSIARRKWL